MSNNRIKFGISLLGLTGALGGVAFFLKRHLRKASYQLMDKELLQYKIKDSDLELSDKEIEIEVDIADNEDINLQDLVGNALFEKDTDNVIAYIDRLEDGKLVAKII